MLWFFSLILFYKHIQIHVYSPTSTQCFLGNDYLNLNNPSVTGPVDLCYVFSDHQNSFANSELRGSRIWPG